MRTFFILSLLFLMTILHGISFAQKTIKAFELNYLPDIDGIFEPEKWMGSDSAVSFVQMEPLTGSPASQKTTCYFGFNKENIYVTFLCYQSNPIIAKNQSRDALSKNDDIVAVILDTYNDNRSGYTFFVNPLGTQIEMKVNDDGVNIDLNWDTEWKCAAGTFKGGWCAELEIPFKSLKYKKGAETWGINFGRIIP